MTEPESPRPPFAGLQAIIWMSFSFFLMVLAAVVLSLFRREALSDLVSLGALSAVTFLLTSALLISFHPAGRSLGSAIGLRPTHPLLVPLGFFGGVVAQIPAEGMLSVIYRYYPAGAEQAQTRLEMMKAHGLVHALVLGLVLSVLVPFAEEIFFRGAVFGALRRSGTSALRAATYTSLGFTLSHFDPAMLLPIGLVASFLGLIRGASGSLWPSILAHMGFNGVTMAFSLSGHDLSEDLLLSPGLQLGGALLLLGITWASLNLAGAGQAAALGRECDEGVGDG